MASSVSVGSTSSAIGGHGRTGADVEEVGDGLDAGVEYKSTGARANVVTLTRRGLHGMRRKQARHAKQRLAKAILEDALVIGKDQRLALPNVEVEIEQETGAVVGHQAL